MAKKWFDSIKKQKGRSNDCDRETDEHTSIHETFETTPVATVCILRSDHRVNDKK